MKTLLLFLAVTMGSVTIALSQNTSSSASRKEARKNLTPAERAKKDTEHATKQLGLTAEQQTTWEAAALKRNTANQPLRDKLQGSTTPEERKEIRNQMKANDQAFKTSVESSLTPEQKQKLEAKKEHHKEKHQHHRKM